MAVRPTPPALVALSPGDLNAAEPRGLERFTACAAALAGAGLRGLMLREPGLEDGVLLALARELRELFAPGAGFLIVHDRLHVALAAGADGAHLGWRSLADADARVVAGALSLGRSTHAGDDPAAHGELEYLVHGPLRAVPKPHAAPPPVGLEGLKQFRARSPLPVWALGGVLPEDAEELAAAGLDGLLVRRAWFDAADPVAAWERSLAGWQRGRARAAEAGVRA